MDPTSYPIRPLTKEWRTGYRRKGRRLLLVLTMMLALVVTVAVIVWA